MDRTLEERVRKQNWVESNSRLFPLLVFTLSILAVIGIAIASEASERAGARRLLAAQAHEFQESIMRQETAYDAVLQIGALYLARTDVTAAEFEELVRAASTSINLHGARGIGWATSKGDGKAGVASAVITYLSPMDAANRSALGFDMYSEPTRRAAIDRAVLTGKPTITAPVVLMQDMTAEKKPGFLMYKPVGGRGVPPKGLVYVAFQGEKFLHSQMRALSHPPEYAALYDGTIADANLLAEFGDREASQFTQTVRLQFGNKEWRMVVGNAPPSMLSPATLWIILVGLFVSGLLLFITRMAVKAAIRDRSAFEWQYRQLQIRHTLNRELNHRVKNTLANVLSILALTRRRSSSLDEFADNLTARIRALSATHGLLTQSEWSNANIRDVFEAELAPFLGGEGPVITLFGPPINLSPNVALSLGLAVHELATNAAKYGALSASDGHVAISWQVVTDERAEIIWLESGGPPVVPPSDRGFGLELLESIVAQEMSESRIEFRPTGLYCRLTLPIRPLPDFKVPA